MKTPKIEKFNLTKVKLLKGGGLYVEYKADEVEEDGQYVPDIKISHPKDVHPDLTRLFLELKPVVAKVYHLDFFRAMVQEEDFEATSEQSKKVEQYYQLILEKIDITGISLKGQDKNAGIVISGTNLTDTKQKTPINTQFIKFNGTKYGFEEELELKADEIKDEVYKFLFENKHAQGSLFDSVEEEEEEYEEEEDDNPDTDND